MKIALATLIIILFILSFLYANECMKIDQLQELNFKALSSVILLSDRVNLLEQTTLRKPSYNAQASLLIVPEGYAYIPVLFKDENTLNKWKSDVQWEDNLKGEEWDGYYDIKAIFKLKEKKCR